MIVPRLFLIYLIIIQTEIFAENFKLISREPAPNFTELAARYGYKADQHDAVTEDGYILRMFHIPGNRGPRNPILIVHAVTDTSDSWLLRGEKSFGITAAKKGHDVWYGNVRGNKYSRRHVTLDPDKDAAFWNFSFHEHGYYDLATFIDTVLSLTGAQKLNVIGHSQGNAVFYILGATRPEYNDKINVAMALAPICFLSHIPPPLSILIELAPIINAELKAAGQNELFGDVTPTGKLANIVCGKLPFRYIICAFGLIFPVFGWDPQEFGPEFFDVTTKHFPSSTSRKNFYHFAQLSRRRSFSKYDYGPSKNMELYGTLMPPDYNLTKVTMPLVLIAGKNDKLSVLADVATLRASLPNVKKYILIEREYMNHLDYVWGEHMSDYLFPHVFSVLEEYN